jgi:Ser/Thr protein kinase RdoA (MazF antagonist)
MQYPSLITFLNEHYPGPLEIEARLATNGQREAYRVRGPGGLYVAKLTDPGRAEQTVRADVGTPAFLAQQGFPAPRPVAARGGQLYLPYGDRFAYLYEYLPGEHPSLQHSFYIRLGSLLARLHALPWEGSGVPESGYRPPEMLQSLRESLQVVAPPEQRALLPELLERIECFPDFSGLPRGIIHSDPYLVNLIEAPGGELWLIDWEDGGISYPLLDVGYVLAHLCTFSARDRTRLGLPGPAEGVLWRPDWSEAFLQSYQAVRPLTPAEQALLPDAIRLSFLVYLPMWGTQELVMDNYLRMKMLESGEAGV